MAEIKIVSGLATSVMDNGAGISFSVGTPPISLTMGAIPVRDPAKVLESLPISDNDYIAVAIRRTALQGSGYQLLAFRRLGLRGRAHPANSTLAAWTLALSCGGVAVSFLADDRNSALEYAGCFVLLMIPCVLRLLSVRKATRLLQAWEPPAE